MAIKPIIAICLTLTLVAGPSFQQQQCTGSSFYTKPSDKNSKSTRITYLENGNYTIQALLMFSEMESGCAKVSQSGLVQMYSIKYALEKFNRDPFYGSRATIGLQLDDSCGQLPITMARGIEVVSYHRSNSVCRSDFIRCEKDKKPSLKNADIKKASAVIGTSMSFTTIPLSSLMSLYDIPQISPSASSRLLSKKDLYKSFFRTIPSDTNQIKAMLAIFKRFKWNYIFAVGSDDDYGKLGVSDLKLLTSNTKEDEKICIFKDEYIPYQSKKTEAKINEVVEKIKEGDKAKVVVLFLYVQNIGEKIIQRAKELGVERIWLTSEAWNPAAATIFSQQDKLEFKNQTHGILSVSLQKQELPGLKSYIRKQVQETYMCNEWLRNYVLNTHGCDITSMKNNAFQCASGNKVLQVSDVVEALTELPGTVDRLIDATYSLGLAMQTVLNATCPNANERCNVPTLHPANITDAMKSIKFENDQGQSISFVDGEPKHAFYTIENLVFDGAKFSYKPVGNWSENNLQLDIADIQWPYWFEESRKNNKNNNESSMGIEEEDFPASRCSQKCPPGTYVVDRTGCCWTCHECQGFKMYTGSEMLPKCNECPRYQHTIDNIKCVPTDIKWLEINDPAGMSIVIISGIGFLAIFAAAIFIARHNKLVSKWDQSPHMITFVCVLLLLTFMYGPLHIIEPMDVLCKFRNGFFFILLMMYCAFVLVQTQAMTSYLKGHADRTFGGRLLMTQFLVLFMFFLLELVSVIAWLYVDGNQLKENRDDDKHVIWKQCEVEFTAARLVSTFIPCIILIIATFCAFRERNADHSFYEPKFLSFSCIALCIIIVAFLPTFRYVVGIYKAIVLAYTMNVFGFTFLACLILPKVYVGVIRKRRGEHEYPMKTGASKAKKKKNDKKQKKNADMSQFESSVADTKTTRIDDHADANADVGDVKMEEKKANGFANSDSHDNNDVAYSNGNGHRQENAC